jgi:uncharacterized protein (TIGR03437 family)
MNARTFLPLLAVLSAVPAAAQHFDASGNATLTGNYFLREVLIAGQNNNGTIRSASSVIGVATFDGKGNYSFNGQGMNTGSGPVASLALNGTYLVAANGLLAISSLVGGKDFAYGGVSAIGASAFVASATEGTNVDILIGIPAGANVTNATLTGTYTAGYIDFMNADIATVRSATFTAIANGAGGLGNLTVAGKAANLGGATTAQPVPGVAYALSGQGAGTITFGPPGGASQLISGTKNFYVSADKNIILGGAPNGFDLLVGVRALGAPAANSTYSGEYYVAGLEDFAGSPQQGGNTIDGFYGSVNATGTGTAIFHSRLQSFAQSVFDYTFSSPYAVNANGTMTPTDIPYQFTLGSNGQAFVATGTGDLYSLAVGFGAPKFSGTGVYLNPLGIVNAANYAPITNPIAPNELVALFGNGLAAGVTKADTLPLPKTLGGVQVTVNGVAAPLFYVSPTQIAILVPSSVGPATGVFYATIQVTSNGVQSNPVTVYTANTAPGVFSLGGNAIGPAAAQHSNFSPVDANNPARPGDTVLLYASGGGAVTPSIPDGSAAPSTQLSSVTAATLVDFGGEQGDVAFAGLTPGLAGLYQLNVLVPSTVGSGTAYVNVSTPDAYTSSATLNISGIGNSSVARLTPALAINNRRVARASE